jgi:hypothetical protein
MRMKKAFRYQIHLLPFLLKLASLRAVPPSLLAHLLCADHLLQFHQVHPVLLRVRLHLQVCHHLQHHHVSNKSKRARGKRKRVYTETYKLGREQGLRYRNGDGEVMGRQI